MFFRTRLLQSLPLRLHKCFVDSNTSPTSPSAQWGLNNEFLFCENYPFKCSSYFHQIMELLLNILFYQLIENYSIMTLLEFGIQAVANTVLISENYTTLQYCSLTRYAFMKGTSLLDTETQIAPHRKSAAHRSTVCVNGNNLYCKMLGVVIKTKEVQYKYRPFTIYHCSKDYLLDLMLVFHHPFFSCIQQQQQHH